MYRVCGGACACVWGGEEGGIRLRKLIFVFLKSSNVQSDLHRNVRDHFDACFETRWFGELHLVTLLRVSKPLIQEHLCMILCPWSHKHSVWLIEEKMSQWFKCGQLGQTAPNIQAYVFGYTNSASPLIHVEDCSISEMCVVSYVLISTFIVYEMRKHSRVPNKLTKALFVHASPPERVTKPLASTAARAKENWVSEQG